MPNVTLYLPEHLHAKVRQARAAGRPLNLSRLVQRELRRELARVEQPFDSKPTTRRCEPAACAPSAVRGSGGIDGAPPPKPEPKEARR